MKASRHEGRWTRNPDGPLSLAEALGFVRSCGVRTPRSIHWYVAEHEGLTLREAGLEWEDDTGLRTADAIYFRGRLGVENAFTPITWETFEIKRGRVSVCVRAEVLRSLDHILFVFSHEIFELRELKSEFRRRGGSMPNRSLAHLIDPRLDGAIHERAVQYSDELVRQFRQERGLDP
jgi:hypothetical protein